MESRDRTSQAAGTGEARLETPCPAQGQAQAPNYGIENPGQVEEQAKTARTIEVTFSRFLI